LEPIQFNSDFRTIRNRQSQSRIGIARTFALVVGFTLVSAAWMATAQSEERIDVWYGLTQSFGHLGGHPQRCINVLGNAAPASNLESLAYQLNGGPSHELSFREDQKRIARDGDFNIELDRSLLLPGKNVLEINSVWSNNRSVRQRVSINYLARDLHWPLPYDIEWSRIKNLQDAVQVIDGNWQLTPQGIRPINRYYDRAVAFGDSSWRDYEVATTITVHALTPPRTLPNTTNVTHAAIALRWPGHDPDGNQPTVKWHPLGATAEFRLENDLQDCRWRIFDGQRTYRREMKQNRVLQFEHPYSMKHRVSTLPGGEARYQVKLWPATDAEPASWDLERVEDVEDVPVGSALLIAHHSDVSFGNIFVRPIPELKQ
jgi:hypothetical protein